MASSSLTLRRAFVADHFHDMPGFVEPRHGHNWGLEATVLLDDAALEEPFARALDGWIRNLDYGLLNAQSRLEGRNPTTELVAAWAFRALEEQGFKVASVKVREKANYWAACTRELS